MGETGFKVNEVKKLATNLKIVKIPEIFGSKEVNKKIESEDEKIKYISFSDMSGAISELFEIVDIDRIFKTYIYAFKDYNKNCCYIE